METKITATELARNLSDVLNRALYRRERFRVERNGEVVAIIEPPPKKAITLGEFMELWPNLSKPDEGYWKDLQEIHDSQGTLPTPPEWQS
jgi:hypothetical protein